MSPFPQSEASSLSDFQASRDAHCSRVAALAKEMSLLLNLPHKLPSIQSLAWLHDCPPDLVSGEGCGSETPNLLVSALQRCREGSASEVQAGVLGEIVSLANSFDEMIEWLSVERRPVREILEELSAMNGLDLWQPEVLEALKAVSQDKLAAALAEGDRLPVGAIATVRRIALIPTEQLSVDCLQRAASQDPVLAADLLRTVNSWNYPNLRKRISSLKEAIVILGTEQSRAVLLASAARGLFASGSIRSLWKHSVEVSATAKELAGMCGYDEEEAFVAGLLHDIGRLALEKLDCKTLERRTRLAEDNMPAVWIDLVTCQHDHAEIGGALLEGWALPKSMVEAIAFHHAPERTRSKLAPILYLAELISDVNEDRPSIIRLTHALKTTGLSLTEVLQTGPSEIFATLLAS